MIRLIIMSAISLLMTANLSAQCEKCPMQGDENKSYCFNKAQLFPGRCASFTDGVNTYLVNLGKKSMALPMPAEGTKTLDYLVSLAANKRYKKLKSLDILFLQEALNSWKSAKMDLGYEYTDTGLGIKITKQGDGAFAEKGSTVVVNYSGYLKDGTKFDSSFDRSEPIEFPLGQGRVIKGWDEGLGKLKVGTRAWLRIPPELGYGSRGAGGAIPPNATLYFDVELVEVK